MEVLKHKGFKTIPFAYPEQPDIHNMQQTLEDLANTLETTMAAAEEVRRQFESCRKLADKLDRLTWEGNRISGFENHLWLVSASDFNSDHIGFCKQLKELIDEVEKRNCYPENMLRLAYIGVPSVYGKDLYRFTENNGARVVFNEVQRQFAMPKAVNSVAEQYCNYTYPFSIYNRIDDINNELEKRRIDGIIHYVQAFCYRGIGDIIFRDKFNLPILTLEGNDNFYLTRHIETRIEAFIDMLKRNPKK
jgi:benzoyl-CoA reductase/2-hydroxyglutaryl-CoA dehydratase subunit BcrC/BadD/HgdB